MNCYVKYEHTQICGAAYGPTDVTDKVRAMYAEGVREFHAENDNFGDTWFGLQKTLVITISFGPNKYSTLVCKEHDVI